MAKLNVLGSYRMDLEDANEVLINYLMRKLGGVLSVSEWGYVTRLSNNIEKCKQKIRIEESI